MTETSEPVTAPEAAEHLIQCVRAGIQGGFHAIGDAAIATVVEAFAIAAERVGVDRLRQGRHRIEHARDEERRGKYDASEAPHHDASNVTASSDEKARVM